MKIVRNKIRLPMGSIGILAEEFSKSRMTIENALNGITQSELAKAIRQRSKEMLLAEAASINETQND